MLPLDRATQRRYDGEVITVNEVAQFKPALSTVCSQPSLLVRPSRTRGIGCHSSSGDAFRRRLGAC
jgi:hypothetical protein